MKVISPKFRVILDYLTVIFLFASPSLFYLSDVAKNICYMLGGIHLLVTICTDFTGGLVKVIPFSIHGLIEFFVGFGLAVAAFTYFKHNNLDQTYFAALGVVGLLVFLLTDYNRVNSK